MDLTTWEGVIEAVRAGAGLALVPRGIAQRGVSREELRVVPIREYRETRPVFLVLAPRWQAEQASHAFATLLERLKSELPAALDLQPAGPHPSGLDPELITGG
jgi:DNA-binding transcriptional LysR family regulator